MEEEQTKTGLDLLEKSGVVSEMVDFHELNDVHLAANILKIFLKSLPEPLIPFSLNDFIEAVPGKLFIFLFSKKF